MFLGFWGFGVFGIAKLSNFIFKTDKNVVAYKVEVIEKEKAATAEKVFDLASLFHWVM